MALYDEHSLGELDRKAIAAFGEHVVLKSLARNATFQRLPRYVAEYLVAKYVRPESWREDLANVQAKLRELLPDLHHREAVKSALLARGEATLVDFAEGRVDLKGGVRWARLNALSDQKVRLPAALAEQHPGILLGGMWGTAKLRYCPEEDAEAPLELVAFTPFQVGPPDLKAWIEKRKEFTADEWMQLLLQSAGYEPAALPDRRTRLLLLARLVPLVERNVNLLELGPRQTGKTFLLRNLSARVFTVSGGRTTPANLFVNLSTNAVGILGTRKVVVFDEIAHTTFGDDDATISTLKDYMESGHFSRGAKSFASDASLVFTGNLDIEDGRPHAKYRHLLEPLPEELVDSAFIDRIHGYLPGWEVPKIAPESLARGVGFVTDYFGEILTSLREIDFQHFLDAVPLAPGQTRRDHVAILKFGSGLGKLLYPDGVASDEERREIALLACELRQRIHDQLVALAPGEFKPLAILPEGTDAHQAPDLARREAEIPRADRLNDEDLVGVASALAVLEEGGHSRGGDLFAVQFSAFAGAPGVALTGRHGPVLRDSVNTAYNVVRTMGREFGIAEQNLRERRIAVHLTRIAELRDGPSAGLAFVIGMVSALTGRKVKAGTACTGEVSLHGEVTAVGGIAEKIAAAAAAGRKLVLVPAENAADVKRLPAELLARLEIAPVRSVAETLERALLPPESPDAPATD
ncbi:MAG TPA: BREX system Lon protease-like protein BrxL [Planctomycetia bacterium]|nr:BREX system Lon protease-like protein BrxL [Planctomycetia bacterium]